MGRLAAQPGARAGRASRDRGPGVADQGTPRAGGPAVGRGPTVVERDTAGRGDSHQFEDDPLPAEHGAARTPGRAMSHEQEHAMEPLMTTPAEAAVLLGVNRARVYRL